MFELTFSEAHSKPVVVFLSGAGEKKGGSRFFKHLSSVLAGKGYHVLFPRSGDEAGLRTISDKAIHIIEVLNGHMTEHNPPVVFFIGHSQGGLVASIAKASLEEQHKIPFRVISLFSPKDAEQHDLGLKRYWKLKKRVGRVPKVSNGVDLPLDASVQIVHSEDPILSTPAKWRSLRRVEKNVLSSNTHFLGSDEIQNRAERAILEALNSLQKDINTTSLVDLKHYKETS